MGCLCSGDKYHDQGLILLSETTYPIYQGASGYSITGMHYVAIV